MTNWMVLVLGEMQIASSSKTWVDVLIPFNDNRYTTSTSVNKIISISVCSETCSKSHYIVSLPCHIISLDSICQSDITYLTDINLLSN